MRQLAENGQDDQQEPSRNLHAIMLNPVVKHVGHIPDQVLHHSQLYSHGWSKTIRTGCKICQEMVETSKQKSLIT